MHIIFAGDECGIAKATISGRVVETSPWRPHKTSELELCWSLEIVASSYFEHEGVRFSDEFSFYHESFQIPEMPRTWMDLVGSTITWDGSNRNELNDCDPMLYINFHEEITYSKLRFVEIDGRNIRVQWDGVVGASASSKAAFSIDCWVKFEGINVRCYEEDDATVIRAILNAYLEPEGFIQHPKQPTSDTVWFEPRI